jgi:hypothetical protein
MLRIRMVQLAFFFIFAAVTKADATMILTASLANLQANSAVTIPTTTESALEFFNAAGDIVNVPLSWRTGTWLSGDWNATERTVALPVAQLPEPAAVILLGIGILIVAFFCRRGLRKR